jgi:hypothetical protein
VCLRFIILFINLWIFIGFGVATIATPNPESFQVLRLQFLQPGKEYRSAPLWVWNTTVTLVLIDSMMQDFKDNAFGGVIIHPRPGLITEYLSDEWLHLWQYALNKAKELDMDI